MKILNKCLVRLFLLGFWMLILYFGNRFSIVAVVSLWAFDFKDECYIFNQNGVFLYIESILLLLGLFLYFLYFIQKKAYNKIILVFSLLAGILGFIFLIKTWINWLEILFKNYNMHDDYNIIKIGFENLFGNTVKAKKIITVATIYLLISNVILENIEIILNEKQYIKETFSNREEIIDTTIIGFTTYLMCPALSIKLFSGFSIYLFFAILIIIEFLYVISNIVIWKRMTNFTKAHENEVTYIVISGSDSKNIFRNLFKKEFNFVKQLYCEQIILASRNEFYHLNIDKQNTISLECFMPFINNHNEIKKTHLKDAIFHIAYCSENFYNSDKLKKSDYDEIIEGIPIKKAIKQIIPYCDKIYYKRNLEDKLQRNQITEKNTKNIFVYNYAEMSIKLQNENDSFQSFTILLNMLEQLNYLYTIILISYQEWDVLTILQRQSDKLTNATFGSWIKLRDFLYGKKQLKHIRPNSYCYKKCTSFKSMMEKKTCDLGLLEKIFQLPNINISDSKNKNNKISLAASFEKMLVFRNYTRGHGIYTFEITDELNLSILEIIKYWFQQLEKFGFLNEYYTNLEQMGWILKYKEKNYYFYSYNKVSHELEYYCFINGTVLSMPYDILK